MRDLGLNTISEIKDVLIVWQNTSDHKQKQDFVAHCCAASCHRWDNIGDHVYLLAYFCIPECMTEEFPQSLSQQLLELRQ